MDILKGSSDATAGKNTDRRSRLEGQCSPEHTHTHTHTHSHTLTLTLTLTHTHTHTHTHGIARCFGLIWCRCNRSEEHTSELQSHLNLVCRLTLEKKNN